jgi:unsaturated rhamnogalacturonyl hydrolase
MSNQFIKTIQRVFLSGIIYLAAYSSHAQDTLWSLKMTETAMSLWPTGSPFNWNYEQGLVMKATEEVWNKTLDQKYFTYIQNKVNYFVGNTGRINTYNLGDYNLDNIASGMALLLIHKNTSINKYKLAADNLRSQLSTQPRTASGGFWHKKVYPDQMWLDGLYMAEPFYARYSALYSQPENFDDIAHQFILLEQHVRDSSTGLLYHAWDESKQQLWANPNTGCSPNFWGRAMGWYAMGLVDVLDYMPESHTKRDSLLQILDRLSVAIVAAQDANGLWWQVLDKPSSQGNYVEASASCMFVYALAKGSRMGYLDTSFWQKASKGYSAILKTFVSSDAQNKAHLSGTCTATGLGGTPYRDGSYAYYTSVPQAQDDARGVGAFILAAVEIEKGEPSVLSWESTENTTSGSKYVISPNPIQDQILIQASDLPFAYYLRDSQGKIVGSGSDSKISAKDFPKGIYFIEIIDQNHKSTLKLIKE